MFQFYTTRSGFGPDFNLHWYQYQSVLEAPADADGLVTTYQLIVENVTTVVSRNSPV